MPHMTKKEWREEIAHCVLVMEQPGADEIIIVDAQETLCTIATCLAKIWLVEPIPRRNALRIADYLESTRTPKLVYVKNALNRCLDKSDLRDAPQN